MCIRDRVKESCAIAEIKPLLHIDVESLKFDIEKIEHTTINQYFTYFECNPYTKTGKLSKFPLILHYATESFNDVNASKNYFGEIYYLQDGSIGKCRLIYWNRRTMYLIDLGLIGKTLSTKKIEKTYNGDKAVIYLSLIHIFPELLQLVYAAGPFGDPVWKPGLHDRKACLLDWV